MKHLLILLLSTAIIFSCQKEEVKLDESVSNNGTESAANRGLVSCDLYDISVPYSTSNYAILAQELTGALWGDYGVLDEHFSCVHGAAPIGGACCPPTNVYLDGYNNTYSYSLYGFESWGPNTAAGQYDYLADNVLSVSEQEQFIDRVYSLANSVSPPCGRGWYSPVGYTVEWSPLNNNNGMNPGVELFVTVTYSATCLFAL